MKDEEKVKEVKNTFVFTTIRSAAVIIIVVVRFLRKHLAHIVGYYFLILDETFNK